MLRRSLIALVDEAIELPDEIVVVNAGDEQADQVFSDFVNRNGITLHLVKTINRGPGANRNVGLPVCTGDIVAITDDDAEVGPDWVHQMRRTHLEHQEAGAVGGSVSGINSQRSFVSRLVDLVYWPTSSEPAYVRTLPTVNISYKREALERVGLFDETLLCGEDVDYNWRLQRLGYRVFYNPEIQVKHHNLTSLKALCLRQYRVGRYYYIVRSKWPGMYCVYPHRLHEFRDYLKAVNFCVSTFYRPFRICMRLSEWTERLGAVPVLLAHQIAWKIGIISQALATTKRKWSLRSMLRKSS